MTTPVTNLDTAFVTEGVEHISFWNGRVLTAEDLRDEQQANADSRARLGRALGAGIGAGLMVSAVPGQPTQVQVTAGNAIALGGEALELPVNVVVSLVVPASPLTGTGVFVTCEDVPSAVPTGSGLYLLVLRPASADRDEAAGVPLDGGGVATTCGPRYSVDGVSFRLVAVDPAGLAAAGGHDAKDVEILSGGDDDLARNVQAYVFMDFAARARLLEDPFGATPITPTMERLRAIPGKLEDCEVPLALVAWSSGGVDHVDQWPVRRPPLPRPAAGSLLDAVAGPRRVHAGMAAVLQFRDHLADAGDAPAKQHFRYLPPAALLKPGPFLTDLDIRMGGALPLAQVGPLLHASLTYPPIDLAGDAAIVLYHVLIPGQHALYLLYVSEHLVAAAGPAPPAPPPGGPAGGAGVGFSIVKITPAEGLGASADVLVDAAFGADGNYTFAAEVVPGPVAGDPESLIAELPIRTGAGVPWQIGSLQPAGTVDGTAGASRRLAVRLELITDDVATAAAASLRINVDAQPATGSPFKDSFTIAGANLMVLA